MPKSCFDGGASRKRALGGVDGGGSMKRSDAKPIVLTAKTAASVHGSHDEREGEGSTRAD